MKIDRTKVKKSSSEAPGDCGWLIEKLRNCTDEELLSVLKSIETWSYGKCELHHWIEVLDRFDSVLEDSTKKGPDNWVLPCDLPENAHVQELVIWVLHFTTLLVEHSFSRHLYSSVEHLITLLSSSSMTIVLAVLNLLYMFSKRSNFITRLAAGPRQALLSRLINLAESWGGKENGFGLAQCCQNLPLSSYPDGATVLHFEFYSEQATTPDVTTSPISSSKLWGSNSSSMVIHIPNIQSVDKSPGEIMEELLEVYKVPSDKQMILFTHLRLAHSFANYQMRLQCVQARLQALSILVYCSALQDNANTVLYSGLLDEFVDVLELQDTNLNEIKAATLRTLTSIIHLERLPNFPKLSTIIDVTGASSYHGFLPVLVRSCISTLTGPPIEPNPFPAPLATALFSFLYHLASYEAGGDALVSCGMMESLLSVVSWVGTEPDHITFVTRAVRVIDLITNLDMNGFQNHGGLNTFIRRLELEVNECRKEQPFVIQLPAPLGAEAAAIAGPPAEDSSAPSGDSEMRGASESSLSPMEVTDQNTDDAQPTPQIETVETKVNEGASTSGTTTNASDSSVSAPTKTNLSCLPQRAALLKSMLNFLKKDNQDAAFSESMRHLMEGSLPSSLKHIISNAEYYGPSLFLLATDVVTVYVFGEPSLLSSLQDNGLTDVVLHALLVKDVPATREVLGSLPNVFSALCLNSRGLQAFVACKPFERLFKVLLSPDYLPAMRRRRSSDPMGDTASNLGNAMDELMRHQPSLKTQAMQAIVKLLEEVCLLGYDSHYVCWKSAPKIEVLRIPTSRSTNDNSSDEEEEEEEERETGGSASVGNGAAGENSTEESPSGGKKPVPLVDYVLNVMKFVDAILSNNSTDDHCKEFVSQKGLVPLLGILGLPNLPIDFPASQACQSVASVCKSILNLAHESGVLQQGLQCLNDKLEALTPLHEPLPSPGGSVLLRELASSPNPTEATSSPQSTPLLHTLSAIHAYIMMLVHICRTGQPDIRQISIKQWGTELGLKVLSGLTQLYCSLVWESTVLFALCSDDALPAGSLFAKEDTLKLLPPDLKNEDSQSDVAMDVVESDVSSGVGASSFPENPFAPSTSSSGTSQVDSAEKQSSSPASQHQMKLIKPLLSAASRLGKALAELFGLLVKLCVGSPFRQRRGQQITTSLTPPSAAAIAVAGALSEVIYAGLAWVPPPSSPLPKFRRIFLICSIRFTNPMLFDEKKMPYHLLLHHFVKSQGLKAFFQIFDWALANEEPKVEDIKMEENGVSLAISKDNQDGTGEFLDTWLFLLEKLVNPKTMLDSPHALLTKGPFCPLKFLMHIQKLAFESVLKLWNRKPLKNYGVKISESVLVILCSILKGEAIIAERLSKEKNSTAAAASDENATIDASNATPSTSEQGITMAQASTLADAIGSTPIGTLSHQSSLPNIMPSHVETNALSIASSPTSVSTLNIDSTSNVPISAVANTIIAPLSSMVPSEGMPSSFVATTSFISLPSLTATTTPSNATTAIETTWSSSTANVSIVPAVTIMPDTCSFAELSITAAPQISTAASDTVPQVSSAERPPSEVAPVTSSAADSRPLLVPSVSVPARNSGSSPDFVHPYLQALLDMGFPQDRCLEAISHTNSLEQATEYLLSNPLSAQAEGEMDFSEDDQWLQAVAMSLRDNLHPVTSTKPPPAELPQSTPTPVVDEEPLSKEKLDEFTSTVLEGCLNQLDIQPQLVYKVCELLTTCVNRNGKEWRNKMLTTLIQQITEQASELQVIATEGASSETAIYLSTSETSSKFAIRLHLVTLLFEEMKAGCADSLEAAGLVDILIGLLCNSHDVMSAYPEVIQTAQKAKEEKAIKKEEKKEKEVEKNGGSSSSADAMHVLKWLAPAMLLLDLYEKLSVATKRRSSVKKVTNHVWKWFDVSGTKWFSYSQSNNKTIDDAYWAGESSIRIVHGRRKYTIQFASMLQVNEESGNRRPVMISISDKIISEHKKGMQSVDEQGTPQPETDDSKQQAMEGTKEESSEETLVDLTPKQEEAEKIIVDSENIEQSSSSGQSNSANKPTTIGDEGEKITVIEGFTEEQNEKMIRSCVGFMKLGVEPDTLHALMRLCLRITRDWHYACQFASLGGIKTLLALTESSAFFGFHNLAALLMRHVLEEPGTLQHTMKKVVRLSAGSSTNMGAKEFHSLMRLLAPAACRDPLLFTKLAQQCLRIDLNMAIKRNLMTTSNEESILMKSIGCKVSNIAGSISNSQNLLSGGSEVIEPQQLINHLLEALATTGEEDPVPPSPGMNTTSTTAATANNPQEERTTSITVMIPVGSSRHLHLSRSSSANDMVVQEMEAQSPMESISIQVPLPGSDSKQASEEALKKKKSLLNKTTICKLLAEFVRSYAGVAKLVTDHQYSSGTNEKITEDCSALAYLLEQLVSGLQDHIMVSHVTVLIAALASCNHSPEAQAALVTEVKISLSRVVSLSESSDKHSKIQALVSLIGTMMESCPAQLNQPVSTCFKQQQLGMNNMIRIMIKKNLVTDLARISHSLDLSSPNMAATINAALKPLETVLRIINIPSYISVLNAKKKSAQQGEQQQPASGAGTGTTNSEDTRAQGEDNAEDAENTEHDISGTGESLEPISDANPNEDVTLVEGDEAGLEEILDQILDDRSRGGSSVSRSTPHMDSVTTTVTYVINHDPPMDTDDTLHDSRMVTHNDSEFLEVHEEGANDDNDVSSSSSEENDGDDNVDDDVEDDDDDDDDGDDDDDDDDDDDEDDEEEEEEGSVFDEGYEDLEEAFLQLPGERDSDDILLLPSYQDYIDTIDSIIFGDRISLSRHNPTHDDVALMASTPNASSNLMAAIPTHPLFQNPREVTTTTAARSGSSRPNRQRGVLRLLGQAHRDVMQITSNLRDATQLFITNADVFASSDPDDFMESQEVTTNSGGGSRSSALPTIPNALTRWMEEARVLEADSMHDAVTQVKPALMAMLEKCRDAEQAEREKKKKEQEANKPPTSEGNSQNPSGSNAENVDMEAASSSGATVALSTSTATSTISTVSPSTANNGSVADRIISFLEQHFSPSSTTHSTSAAPTFSGLLANLSPPASSGSGPAISLLEPCVLAVPEATAASATSTSTNPVYLQLTSASSSATDTTSVTSTVSAPCVFSSGDQLTSGLLTNLATPVTYTSPPLTTSLVTSIAPQGTSVGDPIAFPDTDMIPALPLAMTPTSTAPGPSLNQDEAMSVSPPAFLNQSPEMPIQMNQEFLSSESMDDQNSGAPSEFAEALEGVIQQVVDAALDISSIDRPRTPPSQSQNSNAEQQVDLTSQTTQNAATTEGSLTRLQEQSNATTSNAAELSTPGPSSILANNDYTAILGNIEIPDGVDPSFLAALPEEMRQEVIAEQLRIQNLRQRTTEESQENSTATFGEVNPEFLAALPPNIQEEVLTQQRLEQQRQQVARGQDDPVSFLQTLSSALRQTILSDLEDSQFSALPPDVAQEAQNLRREREMRSRHVHDHLFNRGGGTSISQILRNTARSKVRGQQLLDHEAMTCLLVLLFVDEPKLNTARLHRVLKSLCQHVPTRDWVIITLLSIIKRCRSLTGASASSRTLSESETSLSVLSLDTHGKKSEQQQPTVPPLTSTPNVGYSNSWKNDPRPAQPASWLSMSMDAALGCRANIFQIQKSTSGGKRTPTSTFGTSVHIHPQAAPLVCRHAIDLLISLAKMFPSHFLPTMKEFEDTSDDVKKAFQSATTSTTSTTTTSTTTSSSTTATTTTTGAIPKGGGKASTSTSSGTITTGESATDFWDLLVKLDSINVSRKGKGLPRAHVSSINNSESDVKENSLECSPLGQLIQQLSHPVIKRSSLLTDRLLRLLALVSLGLPDTADSAKKSENPDTLEHLLDLSIQVLTSKSCSEEGLEDATALLLHLSHGPPPARDLVLKLLLQGATTLGQTVTTHIEDLLNELCAYNLSHPQLIQEEEVPQPEKSKKGLLKDRFTSDQVVISTSSKVKPPCEIQLPSMSALTSKTSSQAFFLRTLKVIIQLRDAIRLAKNRKVKEVLGSVTEPPVQNIEGESIVGGVAHPADAANPSEPSPTEANSQPQANAASDQLPPTEDQPSNLTCGSEQMEVSNAEVERPPEEPVTQHEQSMPQPPAEKAPTDVDSQPTVNPLENPVEAMDVDKDVSPEGSQDLKSLSSELGLDDLWSTLSQCLYELGETPDTHAVLVLQPAVEAFFLVHASAAAPEKKSKAPASQETREAQLSHLQHEIAPLSPLPADSAEEVPATSHIALQEIAPPEEISDCDAEKFLLFAETHRSVLNQILRQSTVHLADGPFSVLVDHTRLLDFDIKRKYFRTELERADDGMRREDLAVHVRREHVFEDSFRELHRRSPDEWKNRFYIVFEGEEGQDAGGLLREWYVIISREIFNPMYALFCTSPGDRVTYMINPSSHCNSNHLSYFKFVGRVIAKAIYDNKLLECYFTRSFYKHILGKMVRVQDMESEDYSFYQGLIYLIEHIVADLGYELTFSTEVQEFGVTEVRDLIPGGRNLPVTEENKMDYIRRVCQEKMTGAIRKQLNAFLEGFYDIIPKRLIAIFNEQELELLLSGLPTIDIDDLKNNSEYHKYHPSSLQIQWFWRALRSFDQAERAKLVQFVTGTSKVPLQGFAALEGMNGVQKFQVHRDDRSTDRLPSAHTCFNQLDLPVYETYDKLRHYLLKAVQECSEGFGFA